MSFNLALHTAARAQAAQEARERATYLRALTDLENAAEERYRQARMAHNFMASEHWKDVLLWIAERRSQAEREAQS